MGDSVERHFPLAQVVAIAMLAWALVPINPYDYYIILRFVVCGICGVLAMRAYAFGRINWVWMMGVTAVVYNPLLRVHLSREVWSVINVATILMLAVSIVAQHVWCKEGAGQGEG